MSESGPDRVCPAGPLFLSGAWRRLQEGRLFRLLGGGAVGYATATHLDWTVYRDGVPFGPLTADMRSDLPGTVTPPVEPPAPPPQPPATPPPNSSAIAALDSAIRELKEALAGLEAARAALGG